MIFILVEPSKNLKNFFCSILDKMCENDADYYTKEENYQTEFNKNLKLCIDTFKNLFDDSLKLTCVCAPGKLNLFLVINIQNK